MDSTLDLVTQAKAGNREALDRLFARYLPALRRWASGRLPRQWRYQSSRAYRVVLAEAGHLCQIFCLTATQLGLAPFRTMALAGSRIERDRGLDGVTESVLYVAGVGARPDTP